MDSLQGHRRASGLPAHSEPAPSRDPPQPTCTALTSMQIKDLNSGTFGFVQLALDRTTGRNVAIKFIERGDKVGQSFMCSYECKC